MLRKSAASNSLASVLCLLASVSVEPIKQKITENKDIKVKKKFRKSQPYF